MSAHPRFDQEGASARGAVRLDEVILEVLGPSRVSLPVQRNGISVSVRTSWRFRPADRPRRQDSSSSSVINLIVNAADAMSGPPARRRELSIS